jgi:hypothetical protein
MDFDCNELVIKYVNWLQDNIDIEKIENGKICEVTTPFLDRHNDHLQIYIKREKDQIILTDDGYIISDLRLSGCDLTTTKRVEIRDLVLSGFGIQMDGDKLIVKANPSNFPQKKHNLLQAMISINDLFVMAQPLVASIFREDVEEFLKEKNIRYTSEIKFTGKSGFDHHFDFVIPSSNGTPERILKAINHPSKPNISSLIFSATDTRPLRKKEHKMYGVLNDEQTNVSGDLIDALDRYQIKAMLWSRREDYVQELTA